MQYFDPERTERSATKRIRLRDQCMGFVVALLVRSEAQVRMVAAFVNEYGVARIQNFDVRPNH